MDRSRRVIGKWLQAIRCKIGSRLSKTASKSLNVCENKVEWRWPPSFPCCSVNRQCLWKKTQTKKRTKQTKKTIRDKHTYSFSFARQANSCISWLRSKVLTASFLSSSSTCFYWGQFFIINIKQVVNGGGN